MYSYSTVHSFGMCGWLDDYLIILFLSTNLLGSVCTGAVDVLTSEVVVQASPYSASPEYRKSLAATLFYKVGVLKTLANKYTALWFSYV